MSRILRELFRPSLVDDHGNAIAYTWIGDDRRAVCIDPSSARVYAQVWHDGYGKFYPTIYVPLIAAIPILLRFPVITIGLRSFPRVALEFIRFKTHSLKAAQECVEEMLIALGLI